MGNRNNRYRCELALAAGLSIAGLNACGAEYGPADSDADESAASAQQPLIPGAIVTQTASQHQVPAGQIRDLSISCPPGSSVVGGGYAWGTSGGSLRVYKSARYLANSWNVVAANRSNTQGTTITIAIQCLLNTSASSAEALSAVTTIPAGSTALAQVTCPAGTILSGGGFASGTNALHVYQNTPRSGEVPSWVVRAKNLNSSQPITFQAQAVCLSGVSGSPKIRDIFRGNVPAGGETTITSSTCAEDTLLSSGGSYFSTGTSNTIKANHRDSDPGRWTTTIVNNESTSNSPHLATICLELW